MDLSRLDTRISNLNRIRLEQSGLLLDRSINFAIDQCNKLFLEEFEETNSIEDANAYVSLFLDNYYLKNQLDYEMYEEIWPKLTDTMIDPDFLAYLDDKTKKIFADVKEKIHPELYPLFVKTINFAHLKNLFESKRFNYRYMPQNKYYEDGTNYYEKIIDHFNKFENSFLHGVYSFTLSPIPQLKSWEKNPPLDLTKYKPVFVEVKPKLK